MGCVMALGCDTGSLNQQGPKTAEAKGQSPSIVIPVDAVLPIRDSISEIARTDSRVESENRVDVTSEVVGRCIKVTVEEGDEVDKGDVLVELDKNEQLAQLRQQQAQMTTAERDYQRAKELYANGLNSQQEYDSAYSSYRQQLETVNQTKEQLTKYTIRAPISGIISMKDVQLGQVVSSGTPIFTIVDPSSFMLEVRIEEGALPRLYKGQRAKVKIDALGNEVFETTVRRINPAIDAASGTVGVILDFKDEDLPKLREAAFARVDLVMDTRENALLVPKEAIIEDNARTFLFTVVEQSGEEADNDSSDPIYVAERVEVDTGLSNSAYIEITNGIGDADHVVTYGQNTLKDGSHVRVTTAETELDTAAAVSAEEALEIAAERKARGAEKRAMFTPGPDNN
jgi:membrane fusion protein, multidrug efflux system